MTKNSGVMTCRDPSSQMSCQERWEELLLARLQLCAPGRRTLHAQANLHSSVTPPMCLITAAHFVSYQMSRERARCLSVLPSSNCHMIGPPM